LELVFSGITGDGRRLFGFLFSGTNGLNPLRCNNQTFYTLIIATSRIMTVKSEQKNISTEEADALKLLAKGVLDLPDEMLDKLLQQSVYTEVL
jgi:hypothetical protein